MGLDSDWDYREENELYNPSLYNQTQKVKQEELEARIEDLYFPYKSYYWRMKLQRNTIPLVIYYKQAWDEAWITNEVF